MSLTEACPWPVLFAFIPFTVKSVCSTSLLASRAGSEPEDTVVITIRSWRKNWLCVQKSVSTVAFTSPKQPASQCHPHSAEQEAEGVRGRGTDVPAPQEAVGEVKWKIRSFGCKATPFQTVRPQIQQTSNVGHCFPQRPVCPPHLERSLH